MARRSTLAVSLLVLGITVMAVVACGGGASPSTAASAPASAQGGGGSGNALIAIAKDFSFQLDRTSLPAGEPGVNVTFDNRGAVPHTITFYTDAAFTTKVDKGDSGQVPAGNAAAFTLVVPQVPTLFYRCEIHPAQMSGQIAVQ